MNGYQTTSLGGFGVQAIPLRPVPLAELPVEPLRRLVHDHQLVLLRGIPAGPGPDELTAFCARWGQLAAWPFGFVLELREHPDPRDHVFDHGPVPLHWDGMYREQLPEFQIFHCVSAPGQDQGGRTTFAQTATAWERADPPTRQRWARVSGRYHRATEHYDSTTRSPLVVPHPTRGYPVIRYQEPADSCGTGFVNHPSLEFTGLPAEQLPALHAGLRSALRAPGNWYAHRWQTDDVVIADNHTLLHGREAFQSQAPRHLRRVHVLGDPPLDNPGLVRD